MLVKNLSETLECSKETNLKTWKLKDANIRLQNLEVMIKLLPHHLLTYAFK